MIEKSVLYFLFKDTKHVNNLKLKGVTSKFFTIYEHQALFSLANKAVEKYNDILKEEMIQRINVNNELRQKLILTFTDIRQLTPEATFDFYVDELTKDYKEAQLKKILVKSIGHLENSKIKEAIEEITREITPLRDLGEEDMREGTLADSTDERLKRYQQTRDNPKSTQGILTGFPSIDRMTNGMHKGELFVILGGPKQGKSMLMINMAYNAWRDGKNILFISAELPKSQLEMRVDSLQSEIFHSKIKSGKMSIEDESRYKEILEAQKNSKAVFYILDVPGCPTSLISSKVRELTSLCKFDIIVADYLKLLTPTDKGGSMTEQVGNVALELRHIARTQDIPVLTAMQLTREASKARKITLEHIGVSYAIIQHADVVISIRIQDTDEQDLSDICDIDASIIGNRNGPNGSFTLEGIFSRMYMREKVQ